MFSASISICLAISAVALLMHRIAHWATLRHIEPRPLRHSALPLTVLKPVKGLEEELERNLRSFFEQDYPAPLQLVFASTEPSDPALSLARRIAEEYPHVATRFVLSDRSFGINPKVSNLAGALRAAEHDLVLQADANVRLRPGYLRAVVDEWQETGASILGSLIAARGERSLGAVLDNIQITTFTTPGLCLADRIAGIQCVLGKSMMFRQSELEELGGLALVKDVLAEDFVLGELYAKAGKRAVLSRLIVDNINVEAPVSRFLARHSRWLKMRVVVHFVGFVADLLSNASFFAFLAFIASGFEGAFGALYAIVVGYKVWLDQRLMVRLRGVPMAPRHLLCIPLRDLILPCVWAYALFSRTTVWRGERFRLNRGSLLVPLPRTTVPDVAEAAIPPLDGGS